jgi:hypothetical protein
VILRAHLPQISRTEHHDDRSAFLKQIERTYRDVLDADGVPGGLHLVLDNDAAHKHPNVKAWMAGHPRFKVHFAPTHASWMNLVEVWFGIVERQAIRRGVFKSVKAADQIMAKANRPTTSIRATGS